MITYNIHWFLGLQLQGLTPSPTPSVAFHNGAMAAAAWPFGRWQRLASLLPTGWLKLCGLGVLLSFCWRWRRVLKLWLSSTAIYSNVQRSLWRVIYNHLQFRHLLEIRI
jgi:hypothetical protein